MIPTSRFIQSVDHDVLLNATKPSQSIDVKDLNLPDLVGFEKHDEYLSIEYLDIVRINDFGFLDELDFVGAICAECEQPIDINKDKWVYHRDEYDCKVYCTNHTDLPLLAEIQPLTSLEWWDAWIPEFGSINDWQFCYAQKSLRAADWHEEDDGGFILCNINPESPSFNKFAIAFGDDHGRVGIFTFPLANLYRLNGKRLKIYLEEHDLPTYYG